MRQTSERRAPQGRRRHANQPYDGEPNAWTTAVRPEDIPADRLWCDECRQLVRIRVDGSMFTHRTRSRVPCIGAPYRASDLR